MSSEQLYDTLGATYTVTRRTEPRIAAQVWAALGDARTVLNVGAGTGSYEPSDRDVIAVEPSAVMRAQRPAGAARCVAATAESLPFEDQSFDAAMAFATVHHWQDPIAGLLEMRAWLAVWWCSRRSRPGSRACWPRPPPGRRASRPESSVARWPRAVLRNVPPAFRVRFGDQPRAPAVGEEARGPTDQNDQPVLETD
jgi:SAM-dependent methyltransferase